MFAQTHARSPARPMGVIIAERGVRLDRGQDGALILKQRSGESGREFSARVRAGLAELSEGGVQVRSARLELSAARGRSATERRFGLARVILSQLPDSEELRLGGPLGATEQGRKDLLALAQTLQPQLAGTATTIC